MSDNPCCTVCADMGAKTRGEEVVKPPKGFSNHLWPPKELIFRIFHIFFSKICKIFPPTFSSISLKISIFLQFLDWPPRVLRYHPEDHLSKKKGLQFYKKFRCLKFFLWHLTTSHPVGWKDFGANVGTYNCFFLYFVNTISSKWHSGVIENEL